MNISKKIVDSGLQFLSRPDLFQQQYLHTDVRLALGWAGVGVASFTGLYGWKVEFEKSKPVVWLGLIVCVFSVHPYYSGVNTSCTSRYILLTAIQTLYAYFVEGDIIFVGKRKTFSKRVSHCLSFPITHNMNVIILTLISPTDNNRARDPNLQNRAGQKPSPASIFLISHLRSVSIRR